MKKALSVIFWVALSLGLGFLSSFFQSGSNEAWYQSLDRSALTPPNWVFPVAWTILYILMGVSVGLLQGMRSIYTRLLYMLFAAQLLFNILWTMFFFYLESPVLAFFDIILLDIFVVAYFVLAYMVYRISAWLIIPYILWLAFATYLNGYIIF